MTCRGYTPGMNLLSLLLAAVVVSPVAAEPAASGAQLRAVIAQAEGAGRRRLMDRLPGMAREPFGLCRDLERCPEAPLWLHVADEALIPDAVQALTRPWANLLAARGKRVAPGREALAGFPGASLSVRVVPVPTGGFDVALIGAADPAALYARERSAVLAGSGSAGAR